MPPSGTLLHVCYTVVLGREPFVHSPVTMGNAVDTNTLEPYSAALLAAVERAAPDWIRRRVVEIAAGIEVDVEAIVPQVVNDMTHELAALLLRDVDDQRENPLHVLRRATRFASQSLTKSGVTPVVRDEFEVRAMPDDIFAIGPLAWRDLSEDVHDAGITWGAWKAATILSRRRSEGRLP